MKSTVAMMLLVALSPSLARAESASSSPPPPPTAQAETNAPPPPAAVEPAPPPPPPPRDAQGRVLPEVPQIGDEPLPEWKPPVVKPKALYLSLHPEMQRFQRMRQAGLWVASVGGASLLTSGILYAHALTVNGDISVGCTWLAGGDTSACDGRFRPALEDERDQYAGAAITLMAVGGAMVGTGLIVFGIGQANIKRWHTRHPGDPLPPLSGY